MDVPVPLDALAQVEVLKGSGSTLYGSDATAGVVNFLTRPPEHSEIRLRAGVGNWGTQQQRASVAYVRGTLGQQLTMSRDFFDWICGESGLPEFVGGVDDGVAADRG